MDIESLSSLEYTCIQDVLHGARLNETTATATLIGTVVERIILSLDTGLQKTSVLAASLLLEHTKYPNGVSLVIIPPEASKNIDIIKKWTPLLTHVVLDAENGVQGRNRKHIDILLDKANVVFISPLLLFSDDFVLVWNAKLKHKVKTLLIDESHLLSNPDTQSGYMLKYLSSQIDNLILLTATPGNTFRKFKFLCELCHEETPYYSVSRKDLELEGKFNVLTKIFKENDLYQVYQKIDEPNRRRKYREHVPKDSPLLTDVLAYARALKGKTCIIYTNYLNAQDEIYAALKEAGYAVEKINSSVPPNERMRIGQDIKYAKTQIVITTVTVAIDIPTTNLYLFGWCPDIVQLVGRMNREYRKKDITIRLALIDYESHKVKEEMWDSILLTEVTAKSSQLFHSISQSF